MASYFQAEAVSRKKIALTLFFASVLFELPMALQPHTAHDFQSHVAFLKYFQEGFRAGNFYPRWLSGMYAGCGDATFFFYPPMAFFLALPFMAFTGDPAIALALMVIPLTWLGGLAMYRYLREYAAPNHALLGSLLYLFFPAHQASYYITGSVSEYISYTLVPLILLAVRKVVRGEPRYVLPLAISLSLLLLSSITASLVLALFLPCYFVMEWVDAPASQKPFLRWFLPFVYAAILVLPLTAALTVPFLTERSHTLLGTEGPQGGVAFHSVAIFQPYWLFPIFLSYLFIFALLFRLRGTALDPSPRRIFILLVVVSLYLLLLFSPASFWLWEHVPPLTLLQLPIRLFSFLALPMALLTVLFLQVFHQQCKGVILSAGIISGLTFIVLSQLDTAAMDDPLYIPRHSVRVYHEFLPKQVPAEHWQQAITPNSAEDCREKAKLVQGDAEITIKEWQPYISELEVEARTAAVIRLGRFHYPHWQLTNGTATLGIDPRTGQLLLEIPPKKQVLRIEFREPPLIAWANIISLVSWIVALSCLVFRRRRTVVY